MNKSLIEQQDDHHGHLSGFGEMVIISAFQAAVAGSIPVIRFYTVTGEWSVS